VKKPPSLGEEKMAKGRRRARKGMGGGDEGREKRGKEDYSLAHFLSS